MGLQEHIKGGARLNRNTIPLTDATGSGSINLGLTYSLLSLEVNTPCRFRLYDDLTSRDNVTEKNRPFGDTNIPAPIALVGDFSMSAAGLYTVDPVVFGHNDSLAYYRVEPSGAQVNITRLLLEDPIVPARLGTQYAESNRRVFPTITATSISPNELKSGSITTGPDTIPKTYLLVSASLQNSSQIARLRLYSVSSSIYNNDEKTRPFSVEPSSSVRLLADMILSGSEITKFTPKIMGANLQNLGNDLNEIRGIQEKIAGKNEIYYTLQNVSSSGGPVTINANVYVYALED